MSRLKRKKAEQRDGAAMVEMALLLPLLMMFLLGMVEFGYIFSVHQTMLQAAREGTRIRALTGTTSTEVQDVVETHLATYQSLLDGNKFTIAISGDTEAPASVDISIALADASVMKSWVVPGMSMNAKVVMRKENVDDSGIGSP